MSVFINSNTKITVVYLHDKEENEYRKTINNKKMKSTVKKTIPRVEVLGDSHVRDMGLMLKSKLRTPTVMVNTQPGATVNQICHRLNHKVSLLKPCGVLFVMAGTNNIVKKYGNYEIEHYEDAFKDLTTHDGHTKVAIISVPYRYGNITINQQIDAFNKKVQEICTENNTTFIDIKGHLKKEETLYRIWTTPKLQSKRSDSESLVQHLQHSSR